MTDRTALEIREVDAADRERLVASLPAAELDGLTRLNYVTRDAIVAVDRATGRFVGLARYATRPLEGSTADVAVTVADEWQGRGLGTTMSRTLLWRAAGSGIARVTAAVGVVEDAPSRALVSKFGFRPRRRDGNVVEFELELGR